MERRKDRYTDTGKMDRLTDQQPCRQADVQTDIQTDAQTDINYFELSKDSLTERHKNKLTDKHKKQALVQKNRCVKIPLYQLDIKN